MTPFPPQSERSMIVTGDDFGLDSRVNEAVERHFRAGLLTQASLMVNERGVEEAVRIARRNPGLKVGLHLSLCCGRASEPSALTDRDGRFRPSPARAGLVYAFRPGLREALGAEIARQFQRFAALGFSPVYWDGHTHLHLHPVVLELTLPHIGGFHAVRLVRVAGAGPLPVIFRLLSRAAHAKLPGVAATDHLFGFAETGRMGTRPLEILLANTPRGQSELYYHPGAEPAEPDFQLLRELIEMEGIRLISAADLPTPAPL